MLVILALQDRIKLLPYFIEYYRRLGTTHFAVALWNGQFNPAFHEIDSAFDNHRKRSDDANPAPFTYSIHTSVACDRAAFNAHAVNDGLNRIRCELAPPDGWYCIVDLDEFVWFHGRTFAQMTVAADALSYSALSGFFVDRIAADGSLAEVPEWRPGSTADSTVWPSLDAAFPLTCNLSEVTGAYCGKVSVARSHVTIFTGHHLVALPSPQVWCDALEVHHFKWQAGVREYLEDRHTHFVNAGLPYARESKRALEWITPLIDLHNPALDVRPAERIGI